MPTAIDDILAELDAAERGLVLGLLAVGGDGGAFVAGIVADPVGERCAAALTAIGARPRAERVRLMSVLAREALAPIPTGIEHVHPDTLQQALEFESADTIRLIAVGAPPTLRAAAIAALVARGDSSADDNDGNAPVTTPALATDATADLQRAVLSSIVAVPHLPADARPKRMGLRLLALAPDAILAELRATGAELLGTSLAGSDEATVNRAAAHIDAPWAERIVNAARAGATRTAGETASDSDVDLRSRARRLVGAVVPGKNPRDTLDRLGARALGDRLAREDPDLVVAVAQRLPSDLGRQLFLASSTAEDSPRFKPQDGSG